MRRNPIPRHPLDWKNVDGRLSCPYNMGHGKSTKEPKTVSFKDQNYIHWYVKLQVTNKQGNKEWIEI